MCARELNQEGLVIPPTKLIRRGKIDDEIFNMIISNVRVPKYTIGDLKAQIASLNVGERKILEIVERYGKVVSEAWNRSLEYTERYMRSLIDQIPNFESYAVDYIELKDELLDIRLMEICELTSLGLTNR